MFCYKQDIIYFTEIVLFNFIWLASANMKSLQSPVVVT